MTKPAQLNLIIKITQPNGWRSEWDMEFQDGGPTNVTLAQFAPDGTVVTVPPPVRLTAETFFEKFREHTA
jgi:hypothetical protein